MIFNFNIDKLKIKKEMEVENPFRFSEDVLTILLSMSEQNTVLRWIRSIPFYMDIVKNVKKKRAPIHSSGIMRLR